MSEGRRKAAPVRARRKRHWALRVAGWLAGFFFLGVIGAAATFFIGYQTTDIPDPNKEFATNTTTVYYSDGKTPLGSFYEQNRRSVPLEQIPKHVQDAVIAAEDRTFWTNPGISPSGMARATWNIARGKQLQGGSTITQQYVKIMYLTQERNFSRKFSELFIATKLSRSQDKKETLEGYLNTIYFGEGAYGVAAAGDAYFQVKDPKNLTIPQAAYLATVLNNPTRFDPEDGPAAKQRTLERFRYVLDGMRLTGTITDQQYAAYSKVLPRTNKRTKGNRYAGTQGFLLDMARKELERRGFADDEIVGGGLKVVTTFDLNQQKAMVKASGERPEKKAGLHVGMASVKPGTGELVAMYGGPDYLKSQLNWATARARPGSSFKPFAVAAALEDGTTLRDTYQGDSPIEVRGSKLENEFGNDYGTVDLLQATVESINTAFYDLVDNKLDNGPSKVVDAAEAAGIPKSPTIEKDRDNPSTVLGPNPYASPVDMANAYATFAANGQYVELHTIKTVTDPAGKERWAASKKLKAQQRIDPEAAKLVNYALQQVVEDKKGTGKGAKELDRAVAGKTGTAGGVAVEHRAANAACDGCKEGGDTLTSWWTGYTPQLSTSVLYRAGKSGESDLDPYSDDKAFFGGNWPLKTWLAFMEPAHENLPKEKFDEPDEELLERTPTETPSYTPSKETPSRTPSSPKPPPSSTPPSFTPSTRRPTFTPPTRTGPTRTGPTRTRTKTFTPTFPTIPTGPGPGPGTKTPPPDDE